jgi:crotonobetainyl-CoA:carnitine CoA-transferase CaiB-like acyl-CoA transferase
MATSCAPALGEDTDAVLRELGLGDAEIAALRAQQVIR